MHASLPYRPSRLWLYGFTRWSDSDTWTHPPLQFRQQWGNERFNNARHACCERGTESRYDMGSLRQHANASGAPFAFFAGMADSGVRTLESMLGGSGGNALHAAISLCDRVDVYGAGLYSTAVGAPKVYVHLYDWGAGACIEPELYPAVAAKARQCETRPLLRGAADGATASRDARHQRQHQGKYPGTFCASRESWARARVRTELLLHVLHALEVVRWVQ